MRVRRSPAIVLSLALSAAALLVVPSTAWSDGGTAKDDVDRTSCSDSSWTRIRVAGLDGNNDRFQVFAAVFSDNDDIWAWKLRHDGDLSAQGEVKARDDTDRSFRVIRTMLDFAGPDDVFFRAENQRTGEVCRIGIDY